MHVHWVCIRREPVCVWCGRRGRKAPALQGVGCVIICWTGTGVRLEVGGDCGVMGRSGACKGRYTSRTCILQCKLGHLGGTLAASWTSRGTGPRCAGAAQGKGLARQNRLDHDSEEGSSAKASPRPCRGNKPESRHSLLQQLRGCPPIWHSSPAS